MGRGVDEWFMARRLMVRMKMEWYLYNHHTELMF